MLSSFLVIPVAAVVLGLSVFLQFKRVSYHTHWYVFFILYLLGTAGIIYLFQEAGTQVLDAYIPIRWIPLGALILVLVFATVYNKKYPIFKKVRECFPRSFFLHFNSQFVGAKIGDILFQHSIIIGFVYVLSELVSITQAVLIFSGIFFVSHFFLVFVQGKASGFHFLGSLAAGLIFPPLVLLVAGGGYYLFLLHFSAYVVARLTAPIFLKS